MVSINNFIIILLTAWRPALVNIVEEPFSFSKGSKTGKYAHPTSFSYTYPPLIFNDLTSIMNPSLLLGANPT